MGENSDEDIQQNVKEIVKAGDISPRKAKDLKKDKRRDRNTGTKSNQTQIRSSSVKPAGSK